MKKPTETQPPSEPQTAQPAPPTGGSGAQVNGPGTQPGTYESEEQPVEILVAPAPPPPKARNLYDEATALRKRGDLNGALAVYDQVLQVDPENFDALTDKAWILATHRDAKVRNPAQALVHARRASTNLAKWGLLREDRDSFPDQATTGRNIVVLAAVAAALAAQGQFVPPNELRQQGTAAREELAPLSGLMMTDADCAQGGSAIAVQGFVVQATREMNERHGVESTQESLKQAEHLMELYKARKPPFGEEPVAWASSPLTRLR